MELQLHSFEAGRRGKPDELETQIAHLIGAQFLEIDPNARVDLRVAGGHNHQQDKLEVRVSGEVSRNILEISGINDRIAGIVVHHYNKIHLTNLTADDFMIHITPKPQDVHLASNGAAGDSGNPIAVAYRHTPNNLPWERYLAVHFRNLLDIIYKNNGKVPPALAEASGIKYLEGLKADGKIDVDVLYQGARFHGIPDITIASEHETSLRVAELRRSLAHLVLTELKLIGEMHKINLGTPDITINGLGDWNQGGWKVDEGTREAKSYRDGFGSYGVAEDSFSGEDPSKPSGTGTFLARYIAVQVVGNQLSDFARVALRYTIGQEEVGLNITTNGTSKLPQEELHAWVRENIPLGIKETIERFNLCNPALYHQIVDDSDFFQSQDLPWNKLEVKYK